MSDLSADPGMNPNRKQDAKKAAPDAKPPKPPKKPKAPRELRAGFFSDLFMMLFSLFVLGAIGAFAAVVAVVLYFGRDLPDFSALSNYQPPIVTRAYASDGRLLAEFATEKRVFVPIESVPPLVKNAFISAEDKNFYTHMGIDPVRIVRTAINDVIAQARHRRLKGASTITQQVAKNFLLKDEVQSEKDDIVAKAKRKIKEVILSMRIEQALKKDQILELYLNEIFLGRRVFGVAAASLEYFNKPLEELSIDEAAFLAALPKGPNNYDPDRYPAAALERRNWVIGEMLDNGFITKADAEAAKARPITVIKRDAEQYVNQPYFAEEVRRKLQELYGDKGLYEGGLIAHTTMIPAYQKIAEEALRHGLEGYDIRYGLHEIQTGFDADGKPVYKDQPIAHIKTADWKTALTKVDDPPGTGELSVAVVLESSDKEATVGLRDGRTAVIPYAKMKWAHRKGQAAPAKASDLLKPGDVWLTEATDESEKPEKPAKGEKADKTAKTEKSSRLVYALRQIPDVEGGIIVMDPHTGRIFAIAGGYSYEMSQFNRASQAIRQPGSAFKPFVYLAGLQAGFTPATLILDAPFVADQGPGLPKWRPKNYEKDFNGGPTTMRVGLEKSLNLMTIRLANYVGMDKVADICNKFGVIDNLPQMLSMAIGAGDTTLWRMVTAYSVFVNGGKKVVPTLIDRIQDRNGKTIYVHDARPCPGCGPLVPWNSQSAPDVPDAREQIADPRYMYQIVSMLEGVVQRGTAGSTGLKDLGRPIAGKTGTTSDSKDTWFIGFTPDIIVGSYIGFDEPRTLGPKETGARVAAPVVKEFMERALKDQPPVPFRVPEGIRLVSINPATGTRSKPGDAKSILEAFVAGTEPGDEPMMFTGQGVSTVSDVTNVGESVNTGLGGLY